MLVAPIEYLLCKLHVNYSDMIPAEKERGAVAATVPAFRLFVCPQF